MYNFGKEPDLDLNLDLDLYLYRHQNGKSDPGRHQNDVDPQQCFIDMDPFHLCVFLLAVCCVRIAMSQLSNFCGYLIGTLRGSASLFPDRMWIRENGKSFSDLHLNKITLAIYPNFI